jgi:hypothetical protein
LRLVSEKTIGEERQCGWENGMANRDYRTLLAVGAVLAVAGLVSAAWAFVPSEGTKTRILPHKPDIQGPDPPSETFGLYILMEFSMWSRGEFSGTLNTTSSTPLNEYSMGWKMISQSQYDQFNAMGQFIGAAVFAHIGINDTVSLVRVPSIGKYYLVLSADVIVPNETSVTVHFKMSGLSLKFFVPGVALLLVASPVLFFANKWRKEKGLVPEPKPPN